MMAVTGPAMTLTDTPTTVATEISPCGVSSK